MTLAVQLLLAAVIVSLTVVVLALGIQLFQLLHDLRVTVKKFNRVLDRTRELSETAVRPLAAVNNFFSDVKDLVQTTQDEIIDNTSDKVISSPAGKPGRFHRRFFHQSGLPLRSS